MLKIIRDWFIPPGQARRLAKQHYMGWVGCIDWGKLGLVSAKVALDLTPLSTFLYSAARTGNRVKDRAWTGFGSASPRRASRCDEQAATQEMQNAECRMQNENRPCLSFCILHSAFCIGMEAP